MYREILVPVAYEPDRDHSGALALAQRLAAPGARITLLHVMDEAPAFALDYMPEGWHAELRAAIEADLRRQIAEVENGEVRVLEGDAGRAILACAEEMGCDCIVIASHRPGMGDFLLGSTAARVVRHAGCAVHVLR